MFRYLGSLFFFASFVLCGCGAMSNASSGTSSLEFASANTLSRESEALTCTCRGGPGNYPYECAPVVKTCHGGPGNYPYQCEVCPE